MLGCGSGKEAGEVQDCCYVMEWFRGHVASLTKRSGSEGTSLILGTGKDLRIRIESGKKRRRRTENEERGLWRTGKNCGGNFTARLIGRVNPGL